jgi:anaerobic ribonucleoside-triphosphate reductase
MRTRMVEQSKRSAVWLDHTWQSGLAKQTASLGQAIDFGFQNLISPYVSCTR